MKFHARIASVGESGKKIVVIFHVFAQIGPIGTNFGLLVRLVDLINCAKFYRNRLRVFDSVRGRSLTIPIGLRYRRLTLVDGRHIIIMWQRCQCMQAQRVQLQVTHR